MLKKNSKSPDHFNVNNENIMDSKQISNDLILILETLMSLTNW